jgi:hypothetical protein
VSRRSLWRATLACEAARRRLQRTHDHANRIPTRVLNLVSVVHCIESGSAKFSDSSHGARDGLDPVNIFRP